MEATVNRVVDGGTLSVTLDGKAVPTTISLIGVDAPVGQECYADTAKSKLRSLAGQTVLLESEGNDLNGGRYLWTRKGDGSLSMVNRSLLAGGYVGYDASPLNVRFADWLRQGADAARTKPAGLWKSCTGLHSTSRSNEGASSASGTPRPTEEPSPAAATPVPDEATPAASVRDGVYRGETAEGWPISLTVKHGDVTQFTYAYTCGNARGNGTLNFSESKPIAGGDFSITQTLGPNRLTVSGTFRGDGTASGSLEIEMQPAPCGGPITTTWEARRGG
jgi:endonuclease YncB( thermonuclease family)